MLERRNRLEFLFCILLKFRHLGRIFFNGLCVNSFSLWNVLLPIPHASWVAWEFFLNWCFVLFCLNGCSHPSYSPSFSSLAAHFWLFRVVNIPLLGQSPSFHRAIWLRKATWQLQAASSSLFFLWFLYMALWLNVWILESGRPRFESATWQLCGLGQMV